MTHQTATVDDTVYFYFASNDTSGSGGDGASPLYDVREAGAAADAIPLLSGTPSLLTHANYPAGCHEIAVAATTGNGFAADDTFAVFCTLAVDSQNPSGFVGSCTLTPLAKASNLAAVDTVVDNILVDTGTTLPATLLTLQNSVDGIGSAGGAAISVDANTDNSAGGITGVTSGTTKVGTETGTYANTSALDGTTHTITHATNVIDWVYQYLTGGDTTVTEFSWKGYGTNNDVFNFYVWNHVGAAWELMGLFTGNGGTTNSEIKGNGGTTNSEINRTLFARHRGTSATELGKVYFRIESSATAAVIDTDQITINYAVTSRTIGYANGMFWLDTVEGVAGTETYVNGTADNPSDSLADIITMQSSIPLHDLHVSSDSTFAPTGDFNDYNVIGIGYTATLGGHDYAGTHIYHASPLSGIATTAGVSDHFDVLDSIITTVTSDDIHLTN